VGFVEEYQKGTYIWLSNQNLKTVILRYHLAISMAHKDWLLEENVKGREHRS
jgi:hypothetical protein